MRDGVDIVEVARVAEAFFHVPMRRVIDPPVECFQCEFWGLRVTVVRDEQLDDDMGIPFSQYPLSVNLTLYALNENADQLEVICEPLAIVLGRHLCKKLGVPCVVVQDVERIVASMP